MPGCGGKQSGVSPAGDAGGEGGCSHHFFSQRMASDTCSEFREEEGLKGNYSLCPSVGNDGVSFSHLGFSF